MKKTHAVIVALATVIFPMGMASGQSLTLKVSDTLLGLNQKWAEAYKAKHPTADIQVTGDRTAAVFATLAEKKADLVVVSRGIRYKEAQACVAVFGRRPPDSKVAVSGVAVYANTNNLVKVINYDELAGIFQGQTKNWKELDGGADQAISIYAQATNSVAGELFNDEVLSGRGFSAEVQLLSSEDVLKAVAADPKAVGFGLLTTADGIQPLDIKRARSSTPASPTADNIARRIYPISGYIYSYSNPAANQEDIKAYLDWVRSAEGQQIATAAGFFPVPAAGRSGQ